MDGRYIKINNTLSIKMYSYSVMYEFLKIGTEKESDIYNNRYLRIFLDNLYIPITVIYLLHNKHSLAYILISLIFALLFAKK